MTRVPPLTEQVPGRIRWAAVGAAALALALVGLIPASSAPARTLDDPDALRLLGRSATANERVSYTGTQFVSVWSTMRGDAGSVSGVAKISHQAGQPTEISMHGHESVTGDTTASWLAERGGPVRLLSSAYLVRMGESAQVAGRSADVVEAVRDDGSIAAMLWIDQQTALPLRRETYDADGVLLSASAFVDIAIQSAEPCCSGQTATPDGLDDVDVDVLRDDGWHCPPELGDGFALYQARRVGDAIQFSYSDGVMTVSLFEQQGQLDGRALEGYTAYKVAGGTVYVNAGPPAQYVWATSGRVLTAVSDAPREVIGDVVQSTKPLDAPRAARSDDDGFFDRIGRGAAKIGSWLNPFD